MIEFLSNPWPWYVAGPLIGLTVPALLILGNKSFGISSSMKHICAACLPAKIPFFNYNWKKETWNLIFVLGAVLGGYLAVFFLPDLDPEGLPEELIVEPTLLKFLETYNIYDHSGLLPSELFSWPALFTLRGFIMIVIGGFMVGFGTRYAGGCTSGHSIMGLSNLQWPSLVATCCFMVGGIIMTNFILPFILSL
ncbi:MAG: putative membrane protein YedE/YeeE [Glaciecola sp.]|jgi:uncharacterized membrane protein YedE/YeeE